VIDDFDHVVIYSGDSERTIAFWRDVIGAEIMGEAEWRAGTGRTFRIKVSSDSFINVHPSGSELRPRAELARPGTLDFCFRTSFTTAEVAARFEQHGIPVVLGPVDRTDAMGRPSVSHYVRDPDGNLVEIMSQKG
jgi:catechol 2,3-dioxygenase-like lactoylglutathione lyase family enzyme